MRGELHSNTKSYLPIRFVLNFEAFGKKRKKKFQTALDLIPNFHNEQKETGWPFHHNPTHPSFSSTLISQLLSYLLIEARAVSMVSSAKIFLSKPAFLILSHHFPFSSFISPSFVSAFAASPSITLLSSLSLPLNAELVESRNLHRYSTRRVNPVSKFPQLLQLHAMLFSLRITAFGSIFLRFCKNSNLSSGAQCFNWWSLNCAQTIRISSGNLLITCEFRLRSEWLSRRLICKLMFKDLAKLRSREEMLSPGGPIENGVSVF